MKGRASDAWLQYYRSFDELRRSVYARPYLRADYANGAEYLLQEISAAAFNVSSITRSASPRFNRHLLFEPTTYPWTGPDPNFLYRKAFVDGAGTYRVWGNRGTSHQLLIQTMRAYWNDPRPDMKQLGEYDLDDMVKGGTGEFEIIVSAEGHEGNWIKLDPTYDNNCVFVREAFYDWENEHPAVLHIERIDGSLPTYTFGDDELATKIDGMRRFIEWTIGEYSMTYLEGAEEDGGINTFVKPRMAGHKDAGINPVTSYFFLIFEIGLDEGLVIEMKDFSAEYWGLQTMNVWNEVNEYLDHQSSLNGFQARPDEDGVVRLVVSARDPGVPNWIDSIGLTKGAMLLRLQKWRAEPHFETKVVNLADLRSVLHPSTPVITREERKASLRARRAAGLRRYGYA